MSKQPMTPNPTGKKNPDKPKVLAEFLLIPKQPKFTMESLQPGSREAEIMIDTRHDLTSTADIGYSVFANMLNTRNLTKQDGEKPKTLVVVKCEKGGEFTMGINFEVYNRLSHAARKELLKEQMLRIPYGHFSDRAQRMIQRYGQKVVEVASRMVLSQIINPAILAEEGIILPVPEMWDFERNLTLEEYCEKLWDEGGMSETVPRPIRLQIVDESTNQVANFGGKSTDPELQKLLDEMKDENGLTNLDSLNEVANADGDQLDATVRDFMSQVEAALQAAKTSLKSQGFMRGEAEEFIASLTRVPQLTWQHILRSVNGRHENRKRRISPRKPSRRSDPIVLPNGRKIDHYKGRVKEKTIIALWWIDTSGSMGSRELASIDAELKGMRARGVFILVGQIDAGVAKEPVPYTGFEKLEHFFGRGGTDFRPAFEYAHEMCPRPDYIVYFTDGMGTAPAEESEIPTLWVLTKHGYDIGTFRQQVCEWGDAVEFNTDDD